MAGPDTRPRPGGLVTLLYRILWTDEVTFTSSEVNNFHILYERTLENPSATRPSIVNVWPRLVDSYFIEPYVIANSFSGIVYADFLERTLLSLLEEAPLNFRKCM
jgi:hypothetical protein